MAGRSRPGRLSVQAARSKSSPGAGFGVSIHVAMGWAAESSEPVRPHVLAFDYCDGKRVIAPPGFPYGAWKLMERLSLPMTSVRNDTGKAQKNAALATPVVVEAPG